MVTSRDRRAGSLTSVQSRNRYNLSGSKYSVNGTGTISRSRKNSYATYRRWVSILKPFAVLFDCSDLSLVIGVEV